MAAAGVLIAALLRRLPGLRIHVTAGTADGRRCARELQSRWPESVVAEGFLPWDRPVALRRLFVRLRPRLLVTLEMEIWPALFHEARRAGVPVAVCSARLTRANVRGYRLFGFLFRDLLRHADWIGAQSAVMQRRFVEIGARPERVEVAGNLKWQPPEPSPRQLEDPLAAFRVPGGRVLLAACTHAPEERWILQALGHCLSSDASASGKKARVPGWQLVLAPRHPARCDAIAGECARWHRTAGMLSRLCPSAKPPEVLLVDRMGKLEELYRYASLAIVGGSFCNRGGHSPLEAIHAGCPVLVGPYTGNIEEVARELRDAGALWQLNNPRELSPALRELLDRSGRLEEMARAARKASFRYEGVGAFYAKKLALRLKERPDPDESGFSTGIGLI